MKNNKYNSLHGVQVLALTFIYDLIMESTRNDLVQGVGNGTGQSDLSQSAQRIGTS